MLTTEQSKEADSLMAKVGNSLAAKLTPNELYFCELLHHGNSQADAYLKAHPKSKMSRRSANTVGSRLANEPHILAYRDKIKANLVEIRSDAPILGLSEIMDRDAKRVLLAEVIRNEDIDIAARLRAVEIDNSMAGHVAPKTTVTLAGPLSMAKGLLDRYAQRSLKSADLQAITNELPKLASIPAVETSVTPVEPAPSGNG